MREEFIFMGNMFCSLHGECVPKEDGNQLNGVIWPDNQEYNQHMGVEFCIIMVVTIGMEKINQTVQAVPW